MGFGISATGLQKTGKTLGQVLEGDPGKLTGFIFKNDLVAELPAYTGNVVQETIEQTPTPQPTVRSKLFQYRGGAAIVAAPGDVIPKLYGTQLIQGKVIWASLPYLDDNGRSRIDIAYGICEGPVDGLLRIYGGNDKQLLWGSNSIEGAANGIRFWKKLKLYDGAIDQEESNIIVEYEGLADTPSYHGLCYVVFRGLKLFRFNKSAPDLWFVVGKGFDEVQEDNYADEPTFYDPGTSRQVTSIAGNFDDAPGKLYVTHSGIQVYEVDLDTNTWTVISNSANLGGDLVKDFNAMTWFKGNLYCVTRRGLFRYNGTPLDWTTIYNNGATVVQGSITVDDDDTLIAWHAPDTAIAEIFTYDGTTVVNTGYNRLDLYNNFAAIGIENSTKDIYAIYYKTVSDSAIMRYNGSSWARGTDQQSNNVGTQRIHRRDNLSWFSEYSQTPTTDLYMTSAEWVQTPGSPGSTNNYLIFDDTTSRVNCAEFFSNRWHISRLEVGGTQRLYRLETDLSTVTTMPAPSAAMSYVTNMVQKVSNRLFVGSSRGFWEAGDA